MYVHEVTGVRMIISTLLLKVNDKELSKNLLLGNLAQKLLAVPYKP
jgi:hypothetical protein